jgi:long-chain acyl-CoA synthetase
MHPKVADVAVIGISDPEMGESVQAVIVPSADATEGDQLEKELLGFVGERIARYKVPRGIDFVTELPRTPTGKLRKGELQQRYANRG